MSAPRRVVVGRIVGVHGLGGRVRVRYFGDGPETLLAASKVMLGESAADPEAVAVEVVEAEPGRPREVRMELAGIGGREEASKLKGRLVLVDSGQLDELPEGEYYEYQLVGCRVEGEDGEKLGTVREIWATGASDVLVVEADEGGQHLIPAREDFLREVDVEGRRIVVETVPGLLEAP